MGANPVPHNSIVVCLFFHAGNLTGKGFQSKQVTSLDRFIWLRYLDDYSASIAQIRRSKPPRP